MIANGGNNFFSTHLGRPATFFACQACFNVGSQSSCQEEAAAFYIQSHAPIDADLLNV